MGRATLGSAGLAALLLMLPLGFVLADDVTLQPSDKDSYVNECEPTSNYGNIDSMFVTSYNPGPPLCSGAANARAFVRFGIPSTILTAPTTATLELFLENAPSASRTHLVNRVIASYTENGLHWNNQPSVTSDGQASATTGTTDGVWVSWNVTTIVTSIIDEESANHGFRIVDASENNVTFYQADYRTKEYSGSGTKPRLLLDGVEVGLTLSDVSNPFFRDWETYPEGNLPTNDTTTVRKLGDASSFTNISTSAAHNGTKSVEVEDGSAVAGNSGDVLLQVNTTLPAIAPSYMAEFWMMRNNSRTTGYSLARIVQNYSLNNQFYQIYIVVMTGDSALAACSANSVCFYNTATVQYEDQADLAYGTWYKIGLHVKFDADTNNTVVDAYLNDTVQLSNQPMVHTGLGLRGVLHAFTLQGSGAAGQTSLTYYDDFCVKGDPGDTCSSTYAATSQVRTPSANRIDFTDLRYVEEATDLTYRNYDGLSEWSVVNAKVLELGSAGYQDDEGVDQGTLFIAQNLTPAYYLFYSMRDGNLPVDVLGLATSHDGITFTRYTGNGNNADTLGVVFHNNPVGGTFDDWHTYDPSYVTWRTDRYWMIYTGTQIADGSGARFLSGLAYSYNLTWWQRYPDNATTTPFLDASPGDDCYADAQWQSVVYDSSTALYRALVRCKETEGGTTRTIHWAYSSDLITWTMDEVDDDGRILPEPFHHSGTMFLEDGLWYLLYDRAETPPQTNQAWGLALSGDGIVWRNTKFLFLDLQQISGIATNATNAPDTHLVHQDFSGDRMQFWVSGPSTDGFRYISVIQRPIHRFRSVELLPGVTTGTLTTRPIQSSFGSIFLNIENTANSYANVELLDQNDRVLKTQSDRIDGSGTFMEVTWGGGSVIYNRPLKFRITFTQEAGEEATDTPQLYGILWEAPISLPNVAVDWLQTYGPAWAALVTGLGIMGFLMGVFWFGIKKKRMNRKTGKIWKYLPRRWR